MSDAGDVRIVFVTAPPDGAHDLAHTLVEERLCACVNVVPGIRSVYRWEGAVRDEPESLLILKTSSARVEALARRLEAIHPYETPEFLALRPDSGLPAYLAWVLGAHETEG